ncbi:MAG TPA: discoidin domain-containing protein [Herpetosiphonaceae bacterium]
MSKRFAPRQARGRWRGAALLAFVTLLLASLGLPAAAPAQAPAPYRLSDRRPAYASSSDGGNLPARAVDGDGATLWSSAWNRDPEWITIDLGAQASLSRVVLRWEAAYAKAYQIQVSADEAAWTTIYSAANGDGGTDDIAVSGTGRYVRLVGTQRALAAYGYALWEFEVYGTGGVNPPPRPPLPNLALAKPAAASSEENSPWLPAGSTRAALAVDGDANTRWSSNPSDPQWLQVDLGQSITLGLIVLKWEGAAGRVYDLQVSANGQQWTTIYRQLHGMGETERIPVYAAARFVRVHGVARRTPFGYSLFELEAYAYQSGDPQPSHPIPPIPVPAVTQAGAGSYGTDITLMQPRYPEYKTANLTGPVPSNDWWTSVLIKRLSDGIIPLPLKAQYTDNGLSFYNPGKPWVNGDGGAIETGGEPDLTLMSNTINNPAMDARADRYGDWSVDVVLSDSATPKMKTTFVKGSPYLFNTFSDPSSPELYSPYITRFFDDNNNPILAADGASITADHIGIEVTNRTGAPAPETRVRSYGVFAPAGTVFRRVGNKVKLQLGGGQGYLSIATLPAPQNLNYFYQHAYAFVTDTKASWTVDQATQRVTTTFNTSISLKRAGFASTTLMGLFPHQWKSTSAALTALGYPSIRGQLKLLEGNSFAIQNTFAGITPSFAEPTGSPTYSRAQMQSYLTSYKLQVRDSYWVADPYWQGKKLHTLSMAILIADQIGDTASRDELIGILRTILVNWYSYGGPNAEYPYYFYYSPDWGTLNGDGGDHGMAVNLSDHHFLWGYYTFSSAVLASFDANFKTQYGPMVEHLIRDYANPSRTDSLYPFMRNFDPYEGHSWAGGYGDNNSGNNQESASEALFAWAGMHLWGVATGNAQYRDAGAWGFTLEELAIEQYWFNYDQDAWPAEYRHGVVGIVWGSANMYGTYFSGDPNCIYGIHWLPTAPYITAYGRRPEAAARLYQSFLADKGRLEDGWQHIIWPFQALSDPDGALAKWDDTVLQQDEVFNTYWFLHSMKSMGQRSQDIWASNWSSYSVFKRGATSTAIAWNPTSAPVTVQFRNAQGAVGSLVVAPGKTASTDFSSPPPPSANLALNAPASASSTQSGLPASNAVDGNPATRWGSDWSDPQWLQVDLGSPSNLSRIVLTWEAAYASAYRIEVSDNGSAWTQVYATTTGDGGTDDVAVAGRGRYVRITGTARATGWGHSLWEFEVRGSR